MSNLRDVCFERLVSCPTELCLHKAWAWKFSEDTWHYSRSGNTSDYRFAASLIGQPSAWRQSPKRASCANDQVAARHIEKVSVLQSPPAMTVASGLKANHHKLIVNNHLWKYAVKSWKLIIISSAVKVNVHWTFIFIVSRSVLPAFFRLLRCSLAQQVESGFLPSTTNYFVRNLLVSGLPREPSAQTLIFEYIKM